MGAALAWTARDLDRPLLNRLSFRRALVGFVAVWGPIVLYLSVFYFEWNWTYGFRIHENPVMLTTLAIAMQALGLVAGYALVAGAREIDRPAVGWIATVALAGLLVFVSLLYHDRIVFMGTYEQWRAGDAPLILTTVRSWLEWTAIAAYFSAGFGYCVWANLRKTVDEAAA